MGSLVVGIERDGHARAYPLRALLRASAQRTVLVDTFRSAPIYIKLPHAWNDAVIVTTDTTATAQPLNAYQEYWHSWQHFHPTTTVWKP
jgi:hypothetical protein